MIFISHRGNLDGLNYKRENSLSYIDEAIEKSYDVEVDLRMKSGRLFLGHDEAQYEVDKVWLAKRNKNLWIHVKDFDSLVWISKNEHDLRYFCHESDRYTLTSNGYIWSHDLQNKMTDKCIVPLLSKEQVGSYDQRDFYAVCSDFIYECERTFSHERNKRC